MADTLVLATAADQPDMTRPIGFTPTRCVGAA